MGESSLLKGALFFLCMILALVLFMPKCPVQKLAPHLQNVGPAPKGLRIESSTPGGARAAAPVVYPEGLDAEHLQYMIDIDIRFSAPKMMTFSKDGYEGAALLAALGRLRYVEKQPDGKWGFSREGLLNVSGALDQGGSWSVPVARREFLRTTKLDCSGDECKAEFAWKWHPNNIGLELQIGTPEQHGHASLNASDHRWFLNGISDID